MAVVTNLPTPVVVYDGEANQISNFKPAFIGEKNFLHEGCPVFVKLTHHQTATFLAKGRESERGLDWAKAYLSPDPPSLPGVQMSWPRYADQSQNHRSIWK